MDDSDVESLWLLYRQPHMPRSMSDIIFGIVYHPPDAVNHITTTHIIDNIDAVIRKHSNAGRMIVGDFNQMTDKPLRDVGLKQIVKSATRKSAILDKIYTDIGEWYQAPSILPRIAGSDHRTVLLLPIDGGVRTSGNRIMVTVRSNDGNSKSQLARHLAAFDWSALYEMTSTESMTAYFYDVTTSLLDHYLPLRVVTRYSTDKPWITDEFRRLIRQRQYAYTHNNEARYKRLRNEVNRMSRQLRKRFYAKKIEGLRTCNSTNWWRQTKRLTGQVSKQDLAGLANELTEGNVQELAQRINATLINVSSDLTRLAAAEPADCSGNESETHSDKGEYIVTPEVVFHKLAGLLIASSGSARYCSGATFRVAISVAPLLFP